jgi:DNA invertase Pin-like site-specific DNA recombinase
MEEKPIILIRTSTEDQDPENQLEACQAINRYGSAQIFREQQSAFKEKERPILESIIKLIKARQVSHLIVWDLDRIHRNRRKLIEFFELCKMFGCQIISVRQSWLGDLQQIPAPFDEIVHTLMISIMGWMAEDESKKKGERVKLALRKKDGVTVSRKGNVWGRRSLPEKARLEIIQLKQRNPTLSIREIAAQITYHDPQRNPKHPSKSAVHKILTENTSQLNREKGCPEMEQLKDEECPPAGGDGFYG